MKLREVDPLEPQPGDRVRIYTLINSEDPDHPTNWDEGEVMRNTFEVMELTSTMGVPTVFTHELDEHFGSIYYIVEEA